MGFDMDPWCQKSLGCVQDDHHPYIRHQAMQNFADYGADWRGPQRARHERDPYVQVAVVQPLEFLSDKDIYDLHTFTTTAAPSDQAGIDTYIQVRSKCLQLATAHVLDTSAVS